MKKLVWMLLAGASSAAAAALTVRLLDRAWRRVVHEPPPQVPKWARLIAGNPMQKQVQTRLGPPSL